MSRRLSKKIRAGKHTNRAATNSPKPNFDPPYLQCAPGFAPRRNVRASLLVGTALSAGLLVSSTALVSTGFVMAVVDPAMAGTYSGNYPDGIAVQGVTSSTTITTTGVTNIGGNDTFGNGIELTAGASGLTLGVNTGNATAIGFPNYGPASTDPVFHDGIHVFSDWGNTTISINNAGTIIGTGNNGISADIESYGNNTISVENINAIGNATNPAGYNGVFSKIEANGPRQINYVSNTAPVFASHDGIHAITLARGYSSEGNYTSVLASTTVFNNAYLNAGHEGIHAFSKATA
jgi:hypothetical protein